MQYSLRKNVSRSPSLEFGELGHQLCVYTYILITFCLLANNPFLCVESFSLTYPMDDLGRVSSSVFPDPLPLRRKIVFFFLSSGSSFLRSACCTVPRG